MKLLGRISSRTTSVSEPRSIIEEAADYETAREAIMAALGEDDRLLFLRRLDGDSDLHS